MKWSMWGLGGLALVAAGAILFGALSIGNGWVSAQTEPDRHPFSRFNEALAEELGISVEELEAAELAARNALIDEAVANGRITEEQAERLKSRELGRGFPFRYGPDGDGLGIVAAARNVFQAAADVIGIEPDELRHELADGRSLTEIADDNGVNRDDLKAGIISAVEAEITAAVEDGRLSEERAARLTENLDEYIERALDYTGGLPGLPRLLMDKN
jgi:hypothetical protein